MYEPDAPSAMFSRASGTVPRSSPVTTQRCATRSRAVPATRLERHLHYGAILGTNPRGTRIEALQSQSHDRSGLRRHGASMRAALANTARTTDFETVFVEARPPPILSGRYLSFGGAQLRLSRVAAARSMHRSHRLALRRRPSDRARPSCRGLCACACRRSCLSAFTIARIDDRDFGFVARAKRAPSVVRPFRHSSAITTGRLNWCRNTSNRQKRYSKRALLGAEFFEILSPVPASDRPEAANAALKARHFRPATAGSRLRLTPACAPAPPQRRVGADSGFSTCVERVINNLLFG